MVQPSEQKNRHEVTSERSKANCSKTAARSETGKTGLMNFTLRNQGVGSVKKGLKLAALKQLPLLYAPHTLIA